MTLNMQVQRADKISSQVARSLRAAISELRFKPGEVLVERELCELTGASRPSVREALRQLESEGLVSSVTGKGTIVSSVTVEEARQLYEVRAVLEGLAGRLFTVNASEEQHAALAAVVDRFEADMDRPENLLGIKDEFYRTLFAGAGNAIADQMTTMLQRRTSLLRSTSLSAGGRPKQTLAELRGILAEMRRGNGERVEQLCREHVAKAQEAALLRLAERDAAEGAPDPVQRVG
jgi:DNA-binding GntR family transcriptional regulator